MACHQRSRFLLPPIILPLLSLSRLRFLTILLMLLPPAHLLLDHPLDFPRHHHQHMASVVLMPVPLDHFTPDVFTSVPASPSVICPGTVAIPLLMVILPACKVYSPRMVFLTCIMQILSKLMFKTRILFIWISASRIWCFSCTDCQRYCLVLGCFANDYFEYKLA